MFFAGCGRCARRRADLAPARRSIVPRCEGGSRNPRRPRVRRRESRGAARCALCRERKVSLSPGAATGQHDGPHALPENVIDAVHRIRTDPARLSRSWFDGVIAGGLDVARYVELVGVSTLLAGLDYFARAFGVPPFPLPAPRPGEPSRHRPAGAKPEGAWVAMIAPEDAIGPEG